MAIPISESVPRRLVFIRNVAAAAIAAVTLIAVGSGIGPAAAANSAPAATKVLAWGDNSAGELGNGSLTASTTPVGVGGAAGVEAISAGGRHVLALRSDGTVLAWGDDTSGQLGDGTASANDDAENPVAVSGLAHVTQVSAGTEHSLALLSNGTVVAWGDNSRGELGDGTTTGSDVPVAVKDLSDVRAVSAGDEFSVALLDDGSVMTWGDGANGQLGDGATRDSDVPVAVKGLTGVRAVSAGGAHVLALKSNGTAVAWGANVSGQLGTGSASLDSTVPVAVKSLSGAVAVSAGFQDSLALLSGGDVMAWGQGGGDTPALVPDLSHVTAVSAGGEFSLALLENGTVEAWGDGAFGQLGNGTTKTVTTPTPIGGLTGVMAISAAGVSSAALAAGTPLSAPKPLPSIWGVTSTPTPPITVQTDLDFGGVSAASANSAWAVGTSGALPDDVPLAERWNGSAWSPTVVPLPTGANAADLSGVDDLSPDNAWAVGTTGSQQTLIEHWNGTDWKVVPSPDPGVANALEAIGGTGPDNLWAVGAFENAMQTVTALLFEHWNGTKWSFVAPPDKSGDEIATAVTAIAPDDVWVVGDANPGSPDNDTVSTHWNGTSWTLVKTPRLISTDSGNSLTGVSGTSANDVWGSGFESNVDDELLSQPYMLHWTGSQWHLIQLPNAGTEGSQLNADVALSPSDVWAVGFTAQTDGGTLALTEHYNGTDWSITPAADPGQLGPTPSNTLLGVASPGSGIVWTVGDQEIPGQCCSRTLAEMTQRG